MPDVPLSSRSLLFAAVTLLAGAPVGAQRLTTSLDVGVSRVTWEDATAVTATSLSPAAAWRGDHLTAQGLGSVARLDDGSWTSSGALALSLLSPARGMLRGELATELGGSAHEDGTRTNEGRLTARAHLGTASRGLWLGAGGGRTWDGLRHRSLALGEAGGWWRLGAGTLLATVTPTSIGDSAGRRLRYTDVEASGTWERGRVAVQLSAGARAGGADGTPNASVGWGSAALTTWIAGPLALVLSAGAYPVDPAQGFPGGHHLTAGLRLAPPPRAAPPASVSGVSAEVELAPPGEEARVVTVRVRARGARRVELMGDPTLWEPVALTRGPDGAWLFRARLQPGAHQVMVRVNGGPWSPLPGVPRVEDETGVAGVVVVP